MYPYQAFIAGWLSAWLFPVPHPDYWQIWSERAMRSDVLPHVAGW